MLGFTALAETPLSSLPVSGAPASTYTLSAVAGAFALTGQASERLRGRVLQSSRRMFDLYGEIADLTYLRVYRITTSAASFTSSGLDANLISGRRVVGDAASVALTGFPATLFPVRRLVANAGTFTLTGQAAVLQFNSAGRLQASAGSFVVTTQEVNKLQAYVLHSYADQFAVSGKPAQFRLNNIDSGRQVKYLIGNRRHKKLFVGQRI